MSRLPFELFLALRYLRPKRTFVSVITLISILGVTLGVAVLIIVISVMSGFDHDLREKILGFNAHLVVTHPGQTMKDYEAVAGKIAANKNVRGVSPFVMGPILVETEGDTNHPAYQDAPFMRGIDPQTEGKVSKLPEEIIDGKFDLSGRGVIVGTDFANNLHLSVGDHLSVLSKSEINRMRSSQKNKEEIVVAPDDYEVRGIFSSGYYEYDAHVVIVSIENAQELYDLNDSVHGLFVMTDDAYKAPEVKKQLIAALDGEYHISTWMEQNPVLNAVIVEKAMMYYIMFFIVVVASFGITCTLITFVIMKTREIGLMKAVGATNFQVMVVFVSQSIIVSVVGVASGLFAGLFALHVRNNFLHFMNRVTGWDLFPASVYGFDGLPALISPVDILIICGGSLVICLMAAIIPARYASTLKPVEALRYE